MVGRMLGKVEEKGTTEDEMVVWHHQLDGHEFEQTLEDGEGQESLLCCSPWAHKESDMTERLNNNKKYGADEPICRAAMEMHREQTCGHSWERRELRE